MVTDSIYGVLTPLNAGTYAKISVRTSDSNASNGASVRFGIYAVDPLTLLPGDLLASTDTVAITNSATSTVFEAAFATPVSLAAGNYLVVIHATATTTGARFCAPTTGIPWANFYGNPVLATAHTGGAIIGYYKSGATFASGLPATFGSPTSNITATASSTTNMAPFLILEVA
jgi:hypothetical protein